MTDEKDVIYWGANICCILLIITLILVFF